ncbi:MAG: cyclic nucleotide-binding domain-containing protein [Candidatus Marinimicrobia bacterium]|nr:cyclic nucleotide-binding domain-containing protein [Candidatus Neomarinimicrobiota bacterium]MBL7031244.1 cyclic nucleotide-binding domain-containing protein [Candidatus Neomarinimicrobiota bacterium]
MADQITQQLLEHPIFKGMSFSAISDIIRCASEKTFSRSETIFLEGENAQHCYLILRGSVDLSIHTHNRGPITIQSLHGGDVLGWSWLFSPFIWHFDAIAKEKTNTIRLDGQSIRKICQEDSKIGYELMKRFSRVMQERLMATRLQLVDMYGKYS